MQRKITCPAMVRYCSVPQCSTYCTEGGISLHRYPEEPNLRKQWLVRLRNGKEPSKYAMVCSRHFSEEDFITIKLNKDVCKRRYLKKNAAPTLNLPRRKFDCEKKPRKPPVQRAPTEAVPTVQRGISSCDQEAGDDELQTADSSSLASASTPEHNLGSPIADNDEFSQGGVDVRMTSGPQCTDTVNEVPTQDILQQFASIACVHAGTLRDACVQADTLVECGRHKPLLTYHSVREEDKIRTLTGLGCVQLMENIIREFSVLRKATVARGFVLSDEDVVLMVFVKLYHNINFSFLSVLFGIHRTTVSKIMKTAICILARVLGEAVFFPTKESVMDNMTIYFKQYKNTRVVLDCTEVALERPSDLTSRLLTYSQYKRQYTIKILIGCSPSGMICVVGQGHGGRASDSHLTSQSNVLDMCMPYVDISVVSRRKHPIMWTTSWWTKAS
ncbi:uncharacterized protein LOC135375688 [Ornithodoros turicata]|uniref:uncharacterized protein LOC135375688 n=1 Tax=Ornithodoros turicata TaxID=34597 RepID=UPI0031393096